MKTFVLGGGGGRGALQVGALRALLEIDLRPDLLVGVSVGAANAAYLALHGLTLDALDGLEVAWHRAASLDLLPANYLWLTVRSLFNRADPGVQHHIRDFLIGQGLVPDLRFGQIAGPRLILVAADLRAGSAVLYGPDPGQSVLNGVLASTALPPWVRPRADGDRLLMDGGVVSGLPIEPALTQGATQIVALDLTDTRPIGPEAGGFGPFLFQLMGTMEKRQIYLEKQLAAAQGVPVHHIWLQAESPVPVWEFGRTMSLFERGYTQTRRYLADHPELAEAWQSPRFED
jgi:NTE family protein